MTTDPANGVTSPATADVRAALERATRSAAFLRSPQLQRLLRYLVEETLAGRSDRLKEYVIGVEVFGRPGSFDPRVDSLVRVEARRLRAALDSYYADDGGSDPIVIRLPKGSYHPAFDTAPAITHSPLSDSSISQPVFAHEAALPPASREQTGVASPTHRLSIGNVMLVLVALAAIAASVSGWLMRSRRVQALTDRDSIVLSNFVNSTGEPVFDETLRQGLAVGLEQSPFLNIVSERRISQILKLMGRAASDSTTPEVAREACARAGGRAAIAGSVDRLGAKYIVGLTATNCATGEDFAHVQVEAPNREAVLAALSTAVTQLRGKLGESLASIGQFDMPLEEVTTGSLEALREYSLGRRTARDKGSPADIPFYKHAIELDPDFAIAHAALGVSYVNLGQPGAAGEHLEKAFRLRDRVSEREKYRIAAYYHHAFTGELEQARPIYEVWKQNYPRDVAPYINLGLCYSWLGDYEKAAAVTAEALRLDPGNVLPYSNLAAFQIKLERPDEAATTLEQARARGLTSKFVRSNLGYLAFLRGDTSVMPQQLSEVRDQPGEEDALLSQQSDTEAYYGRLAAARELSRRAVQAAQRAGAGEAAAGWLVNAALREAEVGDARRAQEDVLEALRLSGGRDVLALGALASARAGDAPRAEGLVRDIERTYPHNTVIQRYWLPTIRAAIALDRGRPAEAVEALQRSEPWELASPPPIGLATLYPIYLRGQALLLQRDGVRAGAEFQKILDHPGLVLNYPLRSLAWLHLGRARAISGDMPGARQAYQDFFSAWKAADPDVSVLARARTEYARLR